MGFTQSLVVWVSGVLFPGLKNLDVRLTTFPVSAEVKNEWSYTFIPPMCLHGVYRFNFTFTFSAHGASVPSGPGLPHCRGFTISLRHATFSRTPLDE
jgi:hypothetical protein